MRIIIETIPHMDQRYPTVGDYFYKSGNLRINVSELPSKREMFLIAVHELVEAMLCEAKGITFESIDRFDKQWQPTLGSGARGTPEPGDDPKAPYYRQHQIATAIERLLAAELEVDWHTYERHLEEIA